MLKLRVGARLFRKPLSPEVVVVRVDRRKGIVLLRDRSGRRTWEAAIAHLGIRYDQPKGAR